VYLEPNEIKQLEDAAIYFRDKLLIRLLFRLGCRISEALGIIIEGINFDVGTVTIQHLKSRIKLSCPECGARLGESNSLYTRCGLKVDEAVIKKLKYRKIRTLPVDKAILDMQSN
jgi:integrase/recombinase XerD